MFELAAPLGALVVFLEHRSRVPLALSSLLLFIFFDDAAEYHERLGEYLVQALDLGALAGLRDQDMGELTAWALAAWM